MSLGVHKRLRDRGRPEIAMIGEQKLGPFLAEEGIVATSFGHAVV
jgi:hypothetical protein